MKKTYVIILLGLAVSTVNVFAQGSLSFNSYLANASAGVPVFSFAVTGGGLIGAGFTADLLWSLTPITDPFGNGALSPGWNTSGSGAPSFFNVATPFGTTPTTIGYFQAANPFILNPYTPGTTVYFEVIAYQTGLTYATSIYRGHSASFSTTLATGLAFPTDLGAAGFTSFAFPTPEPSTLTLAGLGGLVAFIAFRRNKV